MSKEEEEEESKFNINAARILTHQIASPLVTIRNHISNIRSGILSEEKVQKRIGDIDELLQLALREIQNFRIISEIHDLTPKIQRIDVDNFLRERVSTFQRHAISNDLKIVISSEKSENYFLQTDYSILSIAVDNLIDNAIKYSYHRGLANNVDEEHSKIIIYSSFQDDNFKLKITNWGYSITTEERELIFSKFFRGKDAIGFSGAGTGIGLYITKKCIESLNGKIDAAIKGHETTFTITLKSSAK